MAPRETKPTTNRTFGVVHWDPKKKDGDGNQGQRRNTNAPAGQEPLSPRERAILAALGVDPKNTPGKVQPGVDFYDYGPTMEAPADVRVQQGIQQQTMNNTLVTADEGLHTVTAGRTADERMADAAYLSEPDAAFMARLIEED